ncbi:MAG: ParB N-terminal domain-containing protein, partial [Planctomycetota bacterium]
MKIRDRIKSLRRVKASDLLPHPANWRTHPQAQQDAMRGVLDEIGWAGACLVRETPDGLQLIDGHLRGDIAGD